MDGTLCDFDGAMKDSLLSIMSPSEMLVANAETASRTYDDAIPWLAARRDLIKRQPGFWRDLKPIPEGLAVYTKLQEIGFDCHILTKGPHRTTTAWTEKVDWCREHVPDAHVMIVEEKSLVYGRVLFDDWPSYIKSWLEWRPRGLVIMLDYEWNRDFNHPNVFRYCRYKDIGNERWQHQEAELERRLREAYER
jgi:5'(3')-deoxyribonucleotidase